ncbi:MAG: phage holin family protein [Desulfomonile tiedjei]|uniref:Phage holin family protein n=1 Tax=Desulfomonile tiedjei TaxID=2358 RepID=A0A9D6Z5Y1_9BACT|nr:phage holin family protein [Desulfomonile tiedjei]
MSGVLVRWLITTIAILVIPYVLSGVRVEGFWSALLGAAVLGILNALVRPLLILLTLPLTIVTLGFFILVINALLFQLAGALVPGLYVSSFWSALFASIIVSIVSWIMNSMVAGGGSDRTIVVRRWGKGSVDMHKDRSGRWE